MDKELIILSDNFGTSFSGGCTATANFVRFWKDSFKEVHVVCKNTDDFLKDNIVFWYYEDEKSLDEILSKLAMKSTIGYGDYHTAVAFIKHNIPFYFTYHDNYPELGEVLTSNSKVEMMMNNYSQIFSFAKYVFSVSNSKLDYIKSNTENCLVVRNGISQLYTKKEKLNIGADEELSILMAGNVSGRKFQFAIELFNIILKSGRINLKVDIFGSNHDDKIFEQLSKFDFVNLFPFRSNISYKDYHIYLCTSTMENLSLSVVDAIKNCTPVIAFDVGGLGEVINNKNGILVQPYDVENMYREIQKIRKTMSRFYFDGQELDNYDWKKSANIMLNIMH